METTGSADLDSTPDRRHPGQAGLLSGQRISSHVGHHYRAPPRVDAVALVVQPVADERLMRVERPHTLVSDTDDCGPLILLGAAAPHHPFPLQLLEHPGGRRRGDPSSVSNLADRRVGDREGTFQQQGLGESQAGLRSARHTAPGTSDCSHQFSPCV